MSADQWYYRLDGKPHGPFNEVQFRKLIRGRAVLPETEVSAGGRTWRPLRDALAGVPVEVPADPSDWADAPTLAPGEVRSPQE